MNFVSPPKIRLSSINENQKVQPLASNSRFFHFIFICFAIVQVIYSISIDFNNLNISYGNQFLRGFLRVINNSVMICLFHTHSKVDYRNDPKKSNILEFLLMIVALVYYIASDYIVFYDIFKKESPTRIDVLLPAFALGLESFWRFFVFYAIARKAIFVIIYVLIMLCFYIIMVFKYTGWLLGGRIFFQLIIMWGVIIYAERIKTVFFLENRKLRFQEKIHKKMLNSLPESTLVLTEEGEVKFTNRYMSSIFKITNQNNFKSSLKNFSTLKFRECIEDEMLKTLASKQRSIYRSPIAGTTAAASSGPNDNEIALLVNDSMVHSPTIKKNDYVDIEEVSKIQAAEELVNYLKANANKWREKSNFALTFDTKYTHFAGSVSSIELKAYVFHDEGEVEFILIFRDTTDRDLIASLESANADYRNNVLATFSHELRTPLNANLGLLENCMDCTDIPQKIKDDIIQPALNSAKLLLYLVNDILDYSQFLNGKLELKCKKESLTQTIRKCVELFEDRFKEKNLTVGLELEEPEEEIYTDHERLSQILINLLSNALKFTTKGGVTVSLIADRDEMFKLSIRDTGIGMEKETQDKLRNNMEKGEFTGKISTNTAGMGIGLFISNLLVQYIFPEKNSGLLFESKRDEGTTFYFYVEDRAYERRRLDSSSKPPTFPSLGPEVEELKQVSTLMKSYHSKIKCSSLEDIEQRPKPKPKKVLIVDDEVMNIVVLETFCKSFGVLTERAFNGKEAVEKVLADGGSHIRLVLTDVNMPVMDGYETATALRKLTKEKKIKRMPIIGVTAYVAKEKIEKCYECGMDEVFNKPVAKGTVLTILKKHRLI